MNELEKDIEIEIKLELGSFADYLKLVGFLGAAESEERQVNGYFDTEDRKLAAAGWALRVRALDDRGLVTLKGLPKVEGAAVMRKEIETEIERRLAMDVLNLRLDILSLRASAIDYVKTEYPGITLARLIQFRNTRQKKQFRFGDYLCMLDVDKTEYHDGSLDYELEVELKEPGQIDVVQNGLQRLFSSLDIPFVPQDKSKYERALLHAGVS
jgi:uncharacterized protein YjbK